MKKLNREEILEKRKEYRKKNKTELNWNLKINRGELK